MTRENSADDRMPVDSRYKSMTIGGLSGLLVYGVCVLLWFVFAVPVLPQSAPEPEQSLATDISPAPTRTRSSSVVVENGDREDLGYFESEYLADLPFVQAYLEDGELYQVFSVGSKDLTSDDGWQQGWVVEIKNDRNSVEYEADTYTALLVMPDLNIELIDYSSCLGTVGISSIGDVIPIIPSDFENLGSKSDWVDPLGYVVLTGEAGNCYGAGNTYYTSAYGLSDGAKVVFRNSSDDSDWLTDGSGNILGDVIGTYGFDRPTVVIEQRAPGYAEDSRQARIGFYDLQTGNDIELVSID